MKKILICLGLLFFMSGCDDGNDTLSCTSSSSANGMTTDTKYEIKYKDDDVKYVTITYDYNQDDTYSGVAGTGTTGNNGMTGTTGTTGTTNDARNSTDNSNTKNSTDVDGVDADTDGLTTNDDNTTNDGIVDGAVGDTIDGAIGGVTNTILDIAGIRSSYENQMSSYDNIKGFSYDVDVDNDKEYKVIYKIDFDKISDSDLTRFNVDRSFSAIRTSYEDLGYTCK